MLGFFYDLSSILAVARGVSESVAPRENPNLPQLSMLDQKSGLSTQRRTDGGNQFSFR